MKKGADWTHMVRGHISERAVGDNEKDTEGRDRVRIGLII